MHKRISALYLDAALYRAKIENRCKRNGEWSLGTFAMLVLELREYSTSVATLDTAAILRYQQIVEIACACLRTDADLGRATEVAQHVRVALGKAADYLVQQTVMDSMTRAQAEELRLIHKAADAIEAALKGLLPDA